MLAVCQLDQGEAVHAGHGQISHKAIYLASRPKERQGFLSAASGRDYKAVLLQLRGDGFADQRIVIDDEHMPARIHEFGHGRLSALDQWFLRPRFR